MANKLNPWLSEPGAPGSVQQPKLFHLNPTDAQLETFWLLCLFVSGKNARSQQTKLQQFLQMLAARTVHFDGVTGPLTAIAGLPAMQWAVVDKCLRECKAGQYERLREAILHSVRLRELLTVKLPGLEGETTRRELLRALIPGAGLKTASFFCMYSHGIRCAVLDTHIIAHLKEKKYLPLKFTLTPANYRQGEKVFLELCRDQGREPWDMDFEIWAARSKSSTVH